MFLFVILPATVIVALLFVGLGIKILVRKHGEFKRPCTNIDPYTGKSSGCSCGRQHLCAHPHYFPLEINDAFMDELKG